MELRSIKRALFIAIMTCIVITSYAQKELLEGTIGSMPIVIKIDSNYNNDSALRAEYFDTTHRKSIQLSGEVKNGSIFLNTGVPEQIDSSKMEKFVLYKNGRSYAGTWSYDGEELPVLLKQASIKNKRGPYDDLEIVRVMKSESPYDYLMISGYVFNKDSSTLKNGYYIDWYTEKYNRTPMLQIRNPKRDKAVEKVNRWLRDAGINESHLASMSTGRINEYRWVVSVCSFFINNNIFSCNICVSYYSGKPGYICSNYNLDMKTGNEIEIDDVIWFGEEITSGRYLQKLQDLFNEQYVDAIANEKLTSCQYNPTEPWPSIHWYFTEKGLHVGPYFPLSLVHCYFPEWAVIPYKVLGKYYNPKSKIKLPD